MHAVYRLIDPRNSETFYVGIAEDVYARFSQHLRCDGSNPAKDARIQELKTANMMVIMETLQLLPDAKQALKREAYWIKHFYDLRAPLTNQVMPLMQENLVILRVKERSSKRKQSRSHVSKPQEQPVVLTGDELIDTVQDLLEQGHGQEAIIEKVWRIKKGGSAKYGTAREEYRKCLAAIKERRQEAYEQVIGD